MISNHSQSFSGDSPLLASLTEEQQQRLTAVLDEYLSALESGTPTSEEALFAAHPDLREPLTHYLRSLGQLQELATAGEGVANRLASAPIQPAPLMQIGDFQLIEQIGRGGMGIVYIAKQLSLSRHVALKILPITSALDSRYIARFQHEARAAAALTHPNIVPVLMVGDDAGVHYYAMHLVEGLPLDEVIELVRATRVEARRSSTCLPEEPIASDGCLVPAATQFSDYVMQVLRIGLQAAEALAAAHRAGVVHRDIKPSNLMVEPGGKLWITDFGLARLHDVSNLTRSGDLVGTLRYMSPEQALAVSGGVDHRTDIYSLGATLYELLCLHPAYSDLAGQQLLQQISSGPPTQLRELCPEIPEEVAYVIARAMARNREERYSTATELAADLARLIEGETPDGFRSRESLLATWLPAKLWNWKKRRLNSHHLGKSPKTFDQVQAIGIAAFSTIVALLALLIALFGMGNRFGESRDQLANNAQRIDTPPEVTSSENSKQSLAALASQLQQEGDREGAADTCDLLIKLLRTEAKSSSKVSTSEELAAALGRRALMARESRDFSHADQLLVEAITLQQTVVEQSSKPAEARCSLSCLMASRALVLREQIDLEQASSLLQAAIEELKAAIQLSPESTSMNDILRKQQLLSERWQISNVPSQLSVSPVQSE